MKTARGGRPSPRAHHTSRRDELTAEITRHGVTAAGEEACQLERPHPRVGRRQANRAKAERLTMELPELACSEREHEQVARRLHLAFPLIENAAPEKAIVIEQDL